MKIKFAAKMVVMVTLLVTFTTTGFLYPSPSDDDTNKTVLQNQDKYNAGSLQDFYLKQSKFTDPGEYVHLYKDLPQELPELCNLIRAQFVHLYAELPQHRELFPRERWNETYKYQTVQQILKGLVEYDSRGLVLERKTQHRLVLGCREYAILFASIMKHRGVPVRLRAGHSKILHPKLRLSHTVCEIWDKSNGQWIMVDPGLAMIDFPREKFDFIHDAWQKMQKGELDTKVYGIPGKYSGFVSIVGKIPHEMAMLLGTEYSIYQYAPILEDAFKNEKLSEEKISTLDQVCELLREVNAKNLIKLREIYNKTPYLQMSKTRDMSKRQRR